MKIRSMRKKGRALLCVFLCLAMFFPLAGCGKRQKNATMVVKNAEDAIGEMAQLGAEAGYENALSELTEKSVATTDGDSYYRLQQNYQGIPVYGRTVVCAVDEKGNVTSITGNVADIDVSVDLTPMVTEAEVLEQIASYMTEVLGLSQVNELDDFCLTDDNLYVYNLRNTEARLAYCMELAGYEFVVDAHTGTVLLANSLIRTEKDAYGTLQGERNFYNNVKYAEEDGIYFLCDNKRKIATYTAENTATSTTDGRTVQVLTSSEIVSFSENSLPDESAVDAYVNMQITYDYFATELGNYATDGNGKSLILICTGVEWYTNGDGTLNSLMGNADSKSVESNGELMTLLRFGIGANGAASLAANLDVVAHEYMHGVESFHSGMIHCDESGAIMEGLSDIFGELVEYWYTLGMADKDDVVAFDWIHGGGRNMADPASNGYPVKPSDPNNSGEDYVHGYSTVISHAAYLMWNGIDGNTSKKISAEDLAKLWYRAMLMMPSDCDFAMCRKVVECAAESMHTLTKAQLTCIGEAFDRVGIKNVYDADDTINHIEYRVLPNSLLYVYDINNEMHSGYTLNIQGPIALDSSGQGGRIMAMQLKNQKIEVTEAAPYALNLETGVYRISITDDYSETAYSFVVQVTADATDREIVLLTSYDIPLIVEIPKEEMTRNVKDTLHLIEYQIMMDALNCEDVEKIQWDLADPDADGTDEFYMRLWRENMQLTYLLLDPDIPVMWAHSTSGVYPYTKYCTIQGQAGISLFDGVDPGSWYDGAYFCWDGNNMTAFAQLSSMHDGEAWSEDETAFWDGEHVTPEEYFDRKNSMVTECDLTDPVFEDLRIEGDYATVIGTLDLALESRPEHTATIKADFDGDGQDECVYLLTNVANSWYDTIRQDPWWTDIDFPEDFYRDTVTAIVACCRDGAVSLRWIQLHESRVDYADATDTGIVLNGTQYVYQSEGDPFVASITEAKQLTAVAVTEDGQITREITLDYDEKGRISEITDRYLGEAGEPDSVSVERYIYDGKGNLIRQESEYPGYTYVDEYVYDNRGNLVSSTIQEPGGWSNNTYEYNSAGQLIRTTEECQTYTEVTEHTYDSAGILTGAKVTRDEFGEISEYRHTYEYDSRQRLVKVVTSGPDGIDTEAYEYDAQGRQTKIIRETAGDTDCSTIDYDHRPFVVHESDDGDVFLQLGAWSLYLGEAELFLDENGYLATAEMSERNRTYQFIYEEQEHQEPAAVDWKALYCDYIEQNSSFIFQEYYSYTIAYVDEDDIPEIFLVSKSAYPGAAILWISDGMVKETVEIGYGDIHYYEKQGLVCTSWVNSGTEVDTIYKLSNGDFTKTHRGRIYSDGSCDWDDKPVTLAEYNSFLSQVFDRTAATKADTDNSLKKLIEDIRNWQ